jgi:hypothetical protein
MNVEVDVFSVTAVAERTHPPPHSYRNQRLQRQFDGLLMMGIVTNRPTTAENTSTSTFIRKPEAATAV